MYIKVVSDTLNVTLPKEYVNWAKKCMPGEQYVCIGATVLTDPGDIISATQDARETLNGFSEYFTVIGKFKKKGYLAMDGGGNLYDCTTRIRRCHGQDISLIRKKES